MGLGALLESLRLFFVCQSACCIDVRDSTVSVAEDAWPTASAVVRKSDEFVPTIFSGDGCDAEAVS